MIIGDRLRALREEKKFSQGDVEHRTGLLRCYISRVENGHTVPAVETLEKFARALEVPMYKLFYDGAEPPKLASDKSTSPGLSNAVRSSGRPQSPEYTSPPPAPSTAMRKPKLESVWVTRPTVTWNGPICRSPGASAGSGGRFSSGVGSPAPAAFESSRRPRRERSASAAARVDAPGRRPRLWRHWP